MREPDPPQNTPESRDSGLTALRSVQGDDLTNLQYNRRLRGLGASVHPSDQISDDIILINQII
jgi:hypothetical protein